MKWFVRGVVAAGYLVAAFGVAWILVGILRNLAA